MRAHQHAAPLVVVRSEAESGRVGLRLIGELDLNTVALLEAELAASREQSPPAVIDLSELRFLDLVGLRALLRVGQVPDMPGTRLVGASGIVRRLIEITSALDAETSASDDPLLVGGLTSDVTAESLAAGSPRAGDLAANGNGNGNNSARGNTGSSTNGNHSAAAATNGDAA